MSGKAFSAVSLLPVLTRAAREAGGVIMSHYRSGHAVERKEDASPVTEADRAADRLIVAALKNAAPDILVVSEEGEQPDVTGAEYFWLVDPLDGTRSFIRGSGYFTVNIGLIAANTPVLGVLYDPVHDAMYWGSEEGSFVERGGKTRPICMRAPVTGKLTALISHSHINPATERYLLEHGVSERVPCASSIKFGMLAEGLADMYVRYGPTMEWDTAAGHAILNAAGGKMLTQEGKPFVYGKLGFLNGGFVARAA